MCAAGERDSVLIAMSALKSKMRKKDGSAVPSYSDDIHRPVTSLVFLLPVVVVYEVGTYLLSSALPEAMEARVLAFELLRRFLALFGATIFYLPGLALPVILAAWHVATGDAWRVRKRTMALMAMESILLAVPLVVLSNVGNSYVPAAAPTASASLRTALGTLFLSMGAGIYEELLFRLMLISLLNMVLIDLARLAEPAAMFIIVLVSAAVFSLYHYLGPEQFTWSSFIFRAVAGGYLAGTFILRGFGITVGCHVMYDVLAMLLNALSGVPYTP